MDLGKIVYKYIESGFPIGITYNSIIGYVLIERRKWTATIHYFISIFFYFPRQFEFIEHQPLPFISILAVASYRIAVQNNKMLHHKTKTKSVKKVIRSLGRSVSVSLSFFLYSILCVPPCVRLVICWCVSNE